MKPLLNILGELPRHWKRLKQEKEKIKENWDAEMNRRQIYR